MRALGQTDLNPVRSLSVCMYLYMYAPLCACIYVHSLLCMHICYYDTQNERDEAEKREDEEVGEGEGVSKPNRCFLFDLSTIMHNYNIYL